MITVLILLAAGLAGIATHFLMKYDDIKKSGKPGIPTFKQFVAYEWQAIVISTLVLFACLLGRNEIKELEQVGKWLALGFFAIGMCAQSVAYFIKGKTKKFFQDSGVAEEIHM